MSSSGLDEIFKAIGLGRWQIPYIAICIIAHLAYPVHLFGTVLLNAQVDFKCFPTASSTPINSTSDYDNQCLPLESYTVNHSSISHRKEITPQLSGLELELGLSNANYTPTERHPTNLPSCPFVEYDSSVHEDTFMTSFDLICERNGQHYLYQFIFSLSVIFSGFTLGPIAYRIGIRTVTLCSSIVVTLCVVVMVLSPSFTVILIARCIIGIFNFGIIPSSFSFVLEVMPPKYRNITGMLIGSPFSLGLMAFAGLGYFVRVWRSLLLISASPILIIIPLSWMCNESPRWLIQKGRRKEAVAILTHAAKTNHISLSPHHTSILSKLAEGEEREMEKIEDKPREEKERDERKEEKEEDREMEKVKDKPREEKERDERKKEKDGEDRGMEKVEDKQREDKQRDEGKEEDREMEKVEDKQREEKERDEGKEDKKGDAQNIKDGKKREMKNIEEKQREEQQKDEEGRQEGEKVNKDREEEREKEARKDRKDGNAGKMEEEELQKEDENKRKAETYMKDGHREEIEAEPLIGKKVNGRRDETSTEKLNRFCCHIPGMRNIMVANPLMCLLLATLYFGLILNANNFASDNPFMYLLSSGGMDLLSVLSAAGVSLVIGRKPLLYLCLSLGSTLILCSIFIPNGYEWLEWLLVMVPLYLIAVAFQVTYVFVVELYPTEVRSLGIGAATCMYNVGYFLSTFITYLMAQLGLWIVNLTFGLCGLTACLFLPIHPETKNHPLPETAWDVEERRQQQRIRGTREKQEQVEIQKLV